MPLTAAPDAHAKSGSMLRRVLREVGGMALATLIGLGALEVALRVAYFIRNRAVDVVPLPYVIGHDYGPVPPWVDGLRILEPDHDLIWRARPGVHRRYIDVFSPVDQEADRTRLIRQFWPRVPGSLAHNPVWEIALNRDGFREVELTPKAPGVFRIVCMGDSWTFGANVGQDESYPARLRSLLAGAAPAGQFEVLNLGVLGYTSFQGRVLLEKRVLGLDPDLIVIGYAMNDGDVAGYRDKDMPGYATPKPTAKQRVLAVAEKSALVKLLKYAALALTHHPKTMAEHVASKASAAPGAKTEQEYASLAEWTRVSPEDYGANLRAMIETAGAARGGQGLPVVLVFNELWERSPYREVIGRVAAEKGVPLVDSSALLARERHRIEAEREQELGLGVPGVDRWGWVGEAGAGAAGADAAVGAAAADSTVTVLFRVFAGERRVQSALYVAGAGPELGNVVPNMVALHDDGTAGDQKAGDRVWSLAVPLRLGAKVAYVYTNSGRQGEWEGLDVPMVRQFTIEARGGADADSLAKGGCAGRWGRELVRPIETFGAVTLQADPWHPSAAGYELIAGEVMQVLRATPSVAARLGSGQGAESVTGGPSVEVGQGRRP
jgi:lysophospholipase L1-like esterase